MATQKETDDSRYGEQESQRAIMEGACHSWHAMPVTVREKAFRFIRENTLLSEPRTYLLEWMLRCRQLGVAEEAKINDLIAEAREKLMAKVLGSELLKRHTAAVKPRPAPAPAKPRTGEDIVPQREMQERFIARGVNLEDIRKHWQSFYYVNGYAATLGSQYQLELPLLKEEVMKRFESALETKEIDTVIIDDARLNDGMTYRLLQPATPPHKTRHFQHARHLKPKSLTSLMKSTYLLRQQIALEQDPVTRKKLIKKIGRRELELTQDGFYNDCERDEKIRLLGVRLHPEIIVEPGPDAELERAMAHLERSFSTMMNIGTFLRLAHFLRTENPLGLYTVASGVNESGEITDPCFFMNNFLTDGRITVARLIMSQDGTIIESQNRDNFFAGAENMAYIPVIQSDLPSPSLERRVIIRRRKIEAAA